jgi:hypothetical protein
MVAGYERYFQIARCFRDEDLRADRQPEFTQLDMEMSFVERDDVLNLIEELMVGMVRAVSLVPLAHEQFPRLSYAEATERFGTDRPDLRYGLELKNDVGDIAGNSAFRVFAENVAAGKPSRPSALPAAARIAASKSTSLSEWPAPGGQGAGLAGDSARHGRDSRADCQVLHRGSTHRPHRATGRQAGRPASSSPATASPSSTTCSARCARNWRAGWATPTRRSCPSRG